MRNGLQCWILLGLTACGAIFPAWGQALGESPATSVDTAGRYASVCGGSTRDLFFYSHAGETVSLPDIVITENHIGALRTDGYSAFATYTEQIAVFDVSGATLKAYRTTDEVDFSAYLVGANKLTSHVRNRTVSMAFKLHNTSEALVGPARIVVSGVKAKLATTVIGGDVNLLFGGAASDNPDIHLPPAEGQGIADELGSRATKSTVKVGYVYFENGRSSYCQESGSTKSWDAECNMVMWNDSLFGKAGSIFVFADVWQSNRHAGFYFKEPSGFWGPAASCADVRAYATGTLGDCKFQVLGQPSDVSSIVGSTLYIGYGLETPGSPPGTACLNMLQRGDYEPVLTIR